VIAYSSWTGTRTTLDALKAAGWRLLMSPDTLRRAKGKSAPLWTDGTPAPYALDNGAWGCFTRKVPFDEERFQWALERIGENADWVVMPDAVGDKESTLEMSHIWRPKLAGYRFMFCVQDGMTEEEVLQASGGAVGLFVGGSTEWKVRTLHQWAQLAHNNNMTCHVGRVNSQKRIRLCQAGGVDSIDGSSVARFPVTLKNLEKALKQQQLLQGEGNACTDTD